MVPRVDEEEASATLAMMHSISAMVAAEVKGSIVLQISSQTGSRAHVVVPVHPGRLEGIFTPLGNPVFGQGTELPEFWGSEALAMVLPSCAKVAA